VKETKPVPTIDPRPLQDPIEELSAIAQASVDPNMQKRLRMLRSAMRTNIEMLNQQRNKAAREALRLGGVLCQKLRDENAAIEAFRKTLDACIKGFGAGYPRCRRYREKLKTDTTIIQYNLGVYADAVLATAQTYSEAVLDEQLQLLMTEISRKQFTALGPFIERFHVQVTDYGRSWRVQREIWNKECGSIP
jgi:hypothetical protein